MATIAVLTAASCSDDADSSRDATDASEPTLPTLVVELVPIEFGGAPISMDLVECDALLAEAEVETALIVDVTPIGRRASSCYWIRGGDIVQLVFNTSDGFPRWREALLQTYTRRLAVTDFEAWEEPGTDSIAAFGPDRGLILHGVRSQPEALGLLRQALPRLGGDPAPLPSAGP